MRSPRQTQASGAHLVLIGCAGGLVGALAMNLFSRAVTAAGWGPEAPARSPQPDREGHGAQTLQADRRGDDATVRVGTAAYRAVTGSVPSRAGRSWLGTAAHYAFGGAAGACYGVMAGRLPIVRAGRGVAYGTAVWIVADETVTPLLDLSRGPSELPAGVHAYALAAHWVFGLTLDAVVRASAITVR